LILFNKPPYTGDEEKYILQVIKSDKISGDGYFGKKCENWFEENLKTKKALLTPSCTAALEMAAILIDIKPGDEVIMPSFTFVSTANAFVLRGAKIVFVDIKPSTMNIDENKIEKAITSKTKAIVVVHYAGVGCEMDEILKIAEKYNLYVIEDAAQGILATYKNRYLGTIGDIGCISFHETKNITSGGEGGAIFINNPKFIKRAEIIREKGTNRKDFFEKKVDKYTWVDIGSSYLLNEVSAAYLLAQLENVKKIIKKRKKIWEIYYNELKSIKEISLPYIPKECNHNGHIFYIKTSKRNELLQFLKDNKIMATFHYVPLHLSPAGKIYGKFIGVDEYTTIESNKLIRLPIFYNMEIEDVLFVCDVIKKFFKGNIWI
jgi:dTDP-4-amino-4,6-dideoxygalactose transaminase